MSKTPDLFSIVDFYIDDLFVSEDSALKGAMENARSAGLPEIQVSPGQAKFIYLMAKMINARNILEIGTLAGYSTIWLARALPPSGRLISLEMDPKHADVAKKNIQSAGLSDRVGIVVGPATETLPRVVESTDPFDLVFLDADKINYPFYFDQMMKKVHSGTLILADNVIREGTVLAPKHDDPSAGAARVFNAMIANDPRLEAIILQQVGIKGHDGLAIARVK